jgi:DNA-directed RNA polymerase specialized sigma subunit
VNTNEIRFYLHNYENLVKEIHHLQNQLAEYRKMNISGIKAQVISDMPVCHSNNSRTEQMACTRVDYIQDLESEIDSKMRIERAINSVYLYLQEPARSIIELRYFVQEQGKRKANWWEIANIVHLSEVRCKQIDMEIVKKIQFKII